MADEIFELKGKVSIDTKSLDSAIDRLKTTLGTITGSAKSSTSEITELVEGLSRVSTVSGEAAGDLDDAEESVKSVGTETKKAGDNAKKSASSFQKLWGQLKRIAVYRAIRSVLKTISNTIKEGTNNLYEFSKLTGEGTFAPAMDSISTSLQLMTNALGTTLAPIITALAPAFESLATIVSDLCEKIARFFALLNGQSGYYKAIKNAKEYQKIQRQLLGFDELNILKDNSSDSTNAFEWIDTFGEMSKFELTIQELGLAIKDIVPENISPGIIGGVVVGAILGGKGIFEALGGIDGLKFNLNEIKSIFNTTDPIINGISKEAVGDSLLKKVLGKVGIFNTDGTLNALTFTLYAISLSMMISSIKTLCDAKNLETDEFWSALKKLAWSSGTFIGTLVANLAGITGVTGGLIGLTIGIGLTLLVQSIKYELGQNATLIEDSNELINTLKGDGTFLEKYGALEEFSALHTRSIDIMANGGVPTQGSLFIAGEAGPELVSNIGGRTQVFNDTQLIGELSVANEGVIGAVLQAANAIVSSVNNIPQPSIRIGDREIYNAAKRGEKVVGRNVVVGANYGI